mgnify:CR=1 FL=1
MARALAQPTLKFPVADFAGSAREVWEGDPYRLVDALPSDRDIASKAGWSAPASHGHVVPAWMFLLLRSLDRQYKPDELLRLLSAAVAHTEAMLALMEVAERQEVIDALWRWAEGDPP